MEAKVQSLTPRLETPRLVLRGLRPDDDEFIFALRSDDEVNRFLDRKKAESIEDARKHMQRLSEGEAKKESFYWAIERKEDNEKIGTICLWNMQAGGSTAEIGYELLPAFHGHGYMIESADCVIDFAFRNLNLIMVTAWMSKDNESSRKLLAKLGFSKDDAIQEEDMDVYFLKKPA